MTRLDVAIVGGGIAGLAHAWSAAERGHRVTLYERSARASGASIRNFGMIWPIGQAAGPLYDVALASRQRWLRLQEEASVWVRACGSIHLAHRADERLVLEQFAERSGQLGVPCQLLSPAEVLARSPAANPDSLLAGLYSPTELCVNPVQAVRSLPAWLRARHAVRTIFSTNVRLLEVEQSGPARIALGTSHGQWERFDRVVVCGGADLQTLLPDLFASAGLRRCKLQMLMTVPQPGGWQLGPHLASGLTLRHYRNFEVCPGLDALRRRVAGEMPELDRFGIHVMASQNDAGEVILGDSHEYDEQVEPFDKAEIDELILRELRRIIRLPQWTVAARWHGTYARHPALAAFEAEPLPEVHVCTGLGGAGMTLSLGLAERAWRQWASS